MRLSTLRRCTYHVLTGIIAFSGAASALIAASLKTDTAYWDARAPWLAGILRWTQDQAPVIVPSLMVLSFLVVPFRRRVGNPWVWDTIKGLLDQIREVAFRDRAAGSPLHHHRVTLFRHDRFRLAFCKWPWSGWLVPVERSGHTTRKCKASFKAPDDATMAEGVAGRTWTENQQVSVYDLPDVSDDSGDRTIKKYAEMGFVSVDWMRKWLKREPVVARAFHGIPIEVRGKVWGVLVLDSREPGQIGKASSDLYAMIAWSMGKLLEKG